MKYALINVNDCNFKFLPKKFLFEKKLNTIICLVGT